MNAAASIEGNASDALTALRLRLRANGYKPVPVTGPRMRVRSPGKQPILPAWQKVCATADEAEVRRWPLIEPGCTNTGLLCDELVAADIDVPVAELAKQLEALAGTVLPPTPLRRVGNAPKSLLCFRTRVSLRKIMTPELYLPDGTKVQVEILAKGQQFVGYGIHPETLSEYEWTESGPDVMPLSELPEVAEADLQSFVAEAGLVIRRFGGRTKDECRIAGESASSGTAAQRLETTESNANAAPRLRSDAGSESFFRTVNQLALDNLQAWVPWLFPRAQFQPGTGAYRITSAELGRKYEEDLSIHPSGIHDFGPDRRLTSIDAVMQFGNLAGARDAAFALCERLGRNPRDLGWNGAKEEKKEKEAAWGSDESEIWPDPVDFLSNDTTGAPELRADHLPEALYPFVKDTALRMGVDSAAVALIAVVSLSSVASDTWCLQPKQHDDTWTENPRLWGAIVGDPSILKTPVLRACTAPIDTMDAQAREQHKDDLRRYKVDYKAWKDAGANPSTQPTLPRLDRYLVEGTTMEAISEVLRDDAEAKQNAPAKKVLCRQDEMSEWLASFDRYRSGGHGGADRGGYLRLYNGGRYVYDRIGRGNFAIPNWSACIVGGIQPDPIRRIAKDAAEDGLLQRFCFCVPPDQVEGEDRKPDRDALQRYRAIFPALAILRPPTATTYDGADALVLHKDAHQYRREINRLAKVTAAMPDTTGRLKAALGKWPGLFA